MEFSPLSIKQAELKIYIYKIRHLAQLPLNFAIKPRELNT